MNYLLKKFISYAENSQSSHCSNDVVKAAVASDIQSGSIHQDRNSVSGADNNANVSKRKVRSSN